MSLPTTYITALDQLAARVVTLEGTGTGTVTSVSGAGTVAGLTLTGTVTASGSLTLGGALDLTGVDGSGLTGLSSGDDTGNLAFGPGGIF